MNHQNIVTYPNYYAVGADFTTAFNSTSSVSEPASSIAVNVWLNGGVGGGARQKGDGDRYCDMRGIGAGKLCQEADICSTDEM